MKKTGVKQFVKIAFFVLIIFLIVFSIVVKVHSLFIKINVRDRNFYQLKIIDKNAKTFSFDVFGDNKNSTRTFEQLIGKINKDNISFAIDVGDMVYDGELDKYDLFLDQIKKIKHPFLTVVGNHELKESGRTNYYNILGRFYYSFSVGDAYFIVLDDGNEKDLDPWQMSWLENKLKDSQSYKYKFVFMHVPLFDPQGKGHCLKNVTFARELEKLFNQYGISMVFASHIHGYFTGKWGNVPFIITGGAGAELMGTDKNHYFYHYIKVNVTNKGVSYQVVKLKTPSYDIFLRASHDLYIYFKSFLIIHFWDIIISLALIFLLWRTFFREKILHKSSK
jgi:3',5'-cyclic AMP phosphodiesterase CpdA